MSYLPLNPYSLEGRSRDELRGLLAARSLPSAGPRAALVARLLDAILLDVAEAQDAKSRTPPSRLTRRPREIRRARRAPPQAPLSPQAFAAELSAALQDLAAPSTKLKSRPVRRTQERRVSEAEPAQKSRLSVPQSVPLQPPGLAAAPTWPSDQQSGLIPPQMLALLQAPPKPHEIQLCDIPLPPGPYPESNPEVVPVGKETAEAPTHKRVSEQLKLLRRSFPVELEPYEPEGEAEEAAYEPLPLDQTPTDGEDDSDYSYRGSGKAAASLPPLRRVSVQLEQRTESLQAELEPYEPEGEAEEAAYEPLPLGQTPTDAQNDEDDLDAPDDDDAESSDSDIEEAAEEVPPVDAVESTSTPAEEEATAEESMVETVDSTVYVRPTAKEEPEFPQDNSVVQIDTYNSDLWVRILGEDRLELEPLMTEGFALMWGAAKANFGFKAGKVAFQLKILSTVEAGRVSGRDESEPWDVRVGWSSASSAGGLGEAPSSFSYSAKAAKATAGLFREHGQGFHKDDVVTALLDFPGRSVRWRVNGVDLGPGLELPSGGDAAPLFPHVAAKNARVRLHFGRGDGFGEPLPDGFAFPDHVHKDAWCPINPGPEDKTSCTVLMMCGLPGCGKTGWISEYLRDNPDETWAVLSTDVVLDAMKVDGVARHKSHSGRWDLVMGLAAKATNRLLSLACRRPANYIVDQTNVMWGSRRRKMAMFKEFGRRKAVIMVPTDEDFADRRSRQSAETGREMPAEAMLEMKAQFSLPNEDDGHFDDLIFVEPSGGVEAAEAIVKRYNEEGKAWRPYGDRMQPTVANRRIRHLLSGYPNPGQPPPKRRRDDAGLSQGSASRAALLADPRHGQPLPTVRHIAEVPCSSPPAAPSRHEALCPSDDDIVIL